ncbi:MAG TPA: EAL domain-containing protein [Gallionella sp.]|nr:EAL domain-containing protein [Gallionella sp.]
MTHAFDLADLKKLLRNNLFLDLDSHALSETAHGLVCDFLDIRLSSAFQPVIDAASNKVLGREALLRASAHDVADCTANAAFERAEEARSLVQFDRLLRTLHLLNHACSFAADELLFLNVHPRLLVRVNDHGRTFEQILHYYSVPPERIVIEISENSVDDKRRLFDAVNNFRNVGYKVAIDDFLPGRASLERVLELKPDIVKLDGRLIRDAEHVVSGKGVVYGLVDILRSKGAGVVIQGIETAEQADIALRSGADGLQGYYLGQPAFPANTDERLGQGEPLAA